MKYGVEVGPLRVKTRTPSEVDKSGFEGSWPASWRGGRAKSG